MTKAEFVGELVTKILPVKNKHAFQLSKSFAFHTSEGLRIVVPNGFTTDLESIPGLVRLFIPRGGLTSWAAVIHDWLYSTHITTRKSADKIFHDALICVGMRKTQAWVYWAGVRIGGWRGWRRDKI